MIDFDRIEGFDWDDGNARKSEDKHSVTNAEAEQIFLNDPLIILEDERHRDMEQRYLVLGKSNPGRLLCAVLTLRNNRTKIRIISVRDMNRRERARYGQEA